MIISNMHIKLAAKTAKLMERSLRTTFSHVLMLFSLNFQQLLKRQDKILLEKFYEIRARMNTIDVVGSLLSPHSTPTSASDSNILEMSDDTTFSPTTSFGDDDASYLGEFRMRTVSMLPPRIAAIDFGEAKMKAKEKVRRAKGDEDL